MRALEMAKAGPTPLPRAYVEPAVSPKGTRAYSNRACGKPAQHTTARPDSAPPSSSRVTAAEWFYTLGGTAASVTILFYAWQWSL